VAEIPLRFYPFHLRFLSGRQTLPCQAGLLAGSVQLTDLGSLGAIHRSCLLMQMARPTTSITSTNRRTGIYPSPKRLRSDGHALSLPFAPSPRALSAIACVWAHIIIMLALRPPPSPSPSLRLLPRPTDKHAPPN
jgi:hypothetical protein